MAFIRTLRAPARSRQPSFVPGSVACAAARPFALSASVRRVEPTLSPPHADPVPAVAGAASVPLEEDRS